MSAKSLDRHKKNSRSPKSISPKQQLLAVLKYSSWVAVGFIVAQFAIAALIGLFKQPIQQYVDAGTIGQNTVNIVITAITFAGMLAIIFGVPYLLKRRTTSRKVLGIEWFPTWVDIGLAIVGTVVAYIGAFAVMAIVMSLFPSIDMQQAQEIGISAPRGAELWLTFLLLVVFVPIVEEVIFRGYLYGKLRQRGVAVWASILVTSLVFALAHGQVNVGLNVFVLSVVMCCWREITGSIWPGILMHMMKNGLAFYLLYVNTWVINGIL